MGDLKRKLESLGLLHDSAIQQLIWKPEENTIEIVIEDFYSNFEGLPEYPGLIGGSIILSSVHHVELGINYDEKYLLIYELQVDDISPDNYRVTVSFRPSGQMQVTCGQIKFPELEIPTPRR